MKKSRYNETQIIKVLKEVEGVRLVKAVCREYGIFDATYYNWKSKYGGMEASDVGRLKDLEDENRRLKQMYTNMSLDHKILECEQIFFNEPLLILDDVKHSQKERRYAAFGFTDENRKLTIIFTLLCGLISYLSYQLV